LSQAVACRIRVSGLPKATFAEDKSTVYGRVTFATPTVRQRVTFIRFARPHKILPSIGDR
jgi:hypothetical protein